MDRKRAVNVTAPGNSAATIAVSIRKCDMNYSDPARRPCHICEPIEVSAGRAMRWSLQWASYGVIFWLGQMATFVEPGCERCHLRYESGPEIFGALVAPIVLFLVIGAIVRGVSWVFRRATRGTS